MQSYGIEPDAERAYSELDSDPVMLADLAQLAEAAAIVAVAWRANRVINRVWDVLRDFPPHLHMNGKILYPKDWEPGRAEALKVRGE